MEPNYIRTHQSAQKSKMMTQKLNESPQDKHKAIYGETHQANYLNEAKGRNSPECRRTLFNDRTNLENPSPLRTAMEAAPKTPVSSFNHQMNANASPLRSPVRKL